MFPPLPYKTDVSLGTLTTLGIGGPARYVVEVKTIADMQWALNCCAKERIPFMVLGKGSNTLFLDQGFNGAILLNKIDFVENSTPGVYRVGSGYNFALLGTHTARAGWSGLEFASGIPASVGGAVFMNAGANGIETCQCLQSVEFAAMDGTLQTFWKEDLDFGYRKSPFQTMQGAIVAATFVLQADPEARQRQLDIIKYRTNTQPYHEKSAGCIFRNPHCGHAGALIEQSGLKGASIGGAMVSTMHANFVVNKENAKATDFLALISHIQATVKAQAGVELEPEVRIVPYEGSTPHV